MTIKQGSVILYRTKKGVVLTSDVLSVDYKKDFIVTHYHKRVKTKDILAIQKTIWDFL